MKRLSLLTSFALIITVLNAQTGILVMQTDFGLKDGAVAAMKGVAMKVSRKLQVFDLTHEIPAYNIWEAAYRLEQAAAYWPPGTVFVSVIDPGVGSERRSVVLKTRSGHFFVTPDNGSLTLVSGSLGIDEVRIIDEKVNRLQGSARSYTFHGRDVYAYTGARLASGTISFRQVGPIYRGSLVDITYQQAEVAGGIISGTIPVLDVQYGNVWTNIPEELLKSLHVNYGDSLAVEIFEGDSSRFQAALPYVMTFAAVPAGQYLGYLNSLLNFSLAINMGNLAGKHSIRSGPEWRITIRKL